MVIRFLSPQTSKSSSWGKVLIRFSCSINYPGPATIYAYDVIVRAGSVFLSNKRVFAVPVTGVPVSVKCEEEGLVYAGCGDGIEIWDAGGTLQAVVEIPGRHSFSVPSLPWTTRLMRN